MSESFIECVLDTVNRTCLFWKLIKPDIYIALKFAKWKVHDFV